MFISIIVFLLFLFYLFSNKRKAIIIAYPVSLLFTTIPLISIGKTHVGLCISIFAIIIIVALENSSRVFIRNPFFVPIALTVLGYLFTWLFGEGRSSLYPLIANIILTLIPLFIYPYIRKEEDIHFFIRCLGIVVGIAVLYSVIEFVLGRNVWMYWLQSQTKDVIFHDHIEDIRFGYGRCNSFFDFPIPFGDVCAITFSFLLFYFYAYKNHVFSTFQLVTILFLLSIGLILSNSRAPLIAIIIGILHYPVFRSKKMLLAGLTISVSLIYFAGDSMYLIYDSMFGNNYANVGGSSANLRTNQFLFCLDQFQQYPYFGGGLNRMEMLQGAIGGRELMGGESQLFVLMVNQGLSGIIPYFLSYLYMVFSFAKGRRRFPLFFSFAWMSAALASLTTGISIAFPMIILLVVFRSYNLGLIKNEQLNGK